MDKGSNYKFDSDYSVRETNDDWVLAPAGCASLSFIQRKVFNLQMQMSGIAAVFQAALGSDGGLISSEELCGIGDQIKSWSEDLEKVYYASAEDVITLASCFQRELESHQANMKLHYLLDMQDAERTAILKQLSLAGKELGTVKSTGAITKAS